MVSTELRRNCFWQGDCTVRTSSQETSALRKKWPVEHATILLPWSLVRSHCLKYLTGLSWTKRALLGCRLDQDWKPTALSNSAPRHTGQTTTNNKSTNTESERLVQAHELKLNIVVWRLREPFLSLERLPGGPSIHLR